MTKSQAAFLFTAQRLFDEFRSPTGKNNRIYFWTVTFACVHADWECARRFRLFINHLREVVGRTGWGGVRVAELHKEHGVHYHLLVTERLAVDLVRRIGRCYGIGRVQVEKADKDSPQYLAKYLTKQREGPLCESGRSARRWAKFGDVPHTRVKDVECDTPMWRFRREHNLPWLTYRWEAVLSRCWDLGEQTFKAAWFAARRDEAPIVCGLANGSLEARGDYKIVERVDRNSWRSSMTEQPW